MEEGEGVGGEGKGVVVGVEEEGEAAIGGDVVHVGCVATDLEDLVIGVLLVIDLRLVDEERINHRQEQL